jgi:hypothetical protein
MPRVQPGETTIELIVPQDAKDALKEMAEIEEIKSVSELVRRLLENYCRHNGKEVSFHVGEWGGNRKREIEELKSTEADDSLQPTDVRIVGDLLQVRLADGRIIAHPLAWYPWLAAATPAQFANRLDSPISIFWPDLENGISIDVLLRGPAKRKEKIKA